MTRDAIKATIQAAITKAFSEPPLSKEEQLRRAAELYLGVPVLEAHEDEHGFLVAKLAGRMEKISFTVEFKESTE